MKAIENHIGENCIDAIVVHNAPIKQMVRKRYEAENAEPVHYDITRLLEMGLEVIEGDIIDHSRQTLRHDKDKIAKLLYSIIENA